MKSLVTGGNGFLGGAIVRMLHARGDEVAVLCRKSYEHLAPYVTRVFQGDLRDATAVRAACKGVDVVFHVAALTGIWGPKREFHSINVEGTRNVIDACRANEVRKLIYTSSPSVVFGRDELCGVDESQPYPKRYLAAYPETKAAAERMVLAANDASLATVSLRPHLIWGPGDPHLIPRVIQRAREGKLIQLGDGANLVDITYIDNAAEAHVLAADALRPGAQYAGRTYFISQGEPVSLWPWLNQILAAVGAPAVTRQVSASAAYRVGALLEAAYRLVSARSEPRMTRFLALQLAKSHYFDISAARRDLGYKPRIGTPEGVGKLVAWLCQRGSNAVTNEDHAFDSAL
jgi:nucleoside-diphosphate-sugar epimerase